MSLFEQRHDDLYGGGSASAANAGGVNLYGDGFFSSLFSKGASALARKGAATAAKAAAKAAARAAAPGAKRAARVALTRVA